MKIRKETGKELALDILYDIVGGGIFAIGTHCFVSPSNIAPGGASGIAIMFNYLFNLPIGTMIFVVNVPLMILAYKYIGKGFTLRTLKSVVISSLMLDVVVAPFFPQYVGDELLGSLFGGVITGVGLAIVFMRDSTTGGSDIAGRLIQVRWPHIPIGQAMLFFDVTVLLVSILVFGSIESGLYGLICMFVCSKVIDGIIYGMDKGTMAVIVSDKTREIAEKVMEEMERGVTLLKGVGAYSGEDKEVALCAVARSQFHRLKTIAYEVDPNAFIIVSEAGEILGEGFKDIKKD